MKAALTLALASAAISVAIALGVATTMLAERHPSPIIDMGGSAVAPHGFVPYDGAPSAH